MTPTQAPVATAVPQVDKSAARKPLIIAIITVVLLVGITLSLFFLNIRTAGQAISLGKAEQVGQGGIFLADNTEEVGKSFSLPVTVNLGQSRSLAFRFSLTYPASLTLDKFLPISKDYYLVDGSDLSVVNSYVHDQTTRTLTGEVTWLCSAGECTNSLVGVEQLAILSFTSSAAGSAPIKFNYLDVYDLATGEDLIKSDGSGVNLKITEKKVEFSLSECMATCDSQKATCEAENPGEQFCLDDYSSCVYSCNQPVTCVDPDKTYDPDATADASIDSASFLKKTTVTGAKSKSAAENPTDSCAVTGPNAGKLLEVYCVNDKEYFWAPQDCPTGTLCQDGACVGLPVPPPPPSAESLCNDQCVAARDACEADSPGEQFCLDDYSSCVYLCSVPAKVDTDGDGVADNLDSCPNTPAGKNVDVKGCPLPPVEATGSSCTNAGEKKVINEEFNVCSNKDGTLKWWLDVGSVCNNDNQCVSGANCKTGFCKLEDGGSCTVGPSCASGVCENGVCVKPVLPITACNKNNPSSCSVKVDCNKAGLLWNAATLTCSACPAGNDYDPVTDACVKVTKKKIQISLEDASKVAVAKATKLKKGDKYTVKVTIAPEKVLPADHLVLVRISYGSVVKTTFVDRRSSVEAGGEEKVEFTHDIAPEATGDVTVDVFVWNNWPSTTDVFEALLPEGGNELEGGSVTYTVQ